MNVGALRNFVTIQQLGASQDAAGQPVESWSTLAQVWADIRYLNGIESIKSDAMTSAAKVSIRIRRRTDVTAAHRVLFGTTVFQINAVLPGDRDYLDLACEVIAGTN